MDNGGWVTKGEVNTGADMRVGEGSGERERRRQRRRMTVSVEGVVRVMEDDAKRVEAGGGGVGKLKEREGECGDVNIDG